MKGVHMAAFLLVVVGAINWGLSALGFNLVQMLFGSWPTVEKVVYLLVGVSGVYLLVQHKGDCKTCA